MDYLPRKEAEFVQWSRNFTALISAEPERYGLDESQAAGHQALHDAFIEAYRIGTDPNTRTTTAVGIKNAARAKVVQSTRELVRVIQSARTTTNDMRTSLGITVRDVEPTPVPAPDTAPELVLRSILGRRAEVLLVDSSSGRRFGKPEGVFGAQIYCCIADGDPPEELNQWTLLATTTRAHVEVEMPIFIPAGAKVRLTACWINPTAQPGPLGPVINARFTENVARAA
jgi:hypothetical protein